MIRYLFVIWCLLSGRSEAHAEPPEDRTSVSLKNYLLWRAEIHGFNVLVSATPLLHLSAEERAEATFVPSSLGAQCNWNMTVRMNQFVRVMLNAGGEQFPLAALPADIDPYIMAWRWCSGVSLDGRYALGCTGWWALSSFQLFDTRANKLISQKTLPWTDPSSFSGFVQDERVLGYCTIPVSPDVAKRSSPERNLGYPGQIRRIYAISKSGEWIAIPDLDVWSMRASRSGRRILLRRENNLLEVRPSALDHVVWTKWLADPFVGEEWLAVWGGAWSSDDRIVAVAQGVDRQDPNQVALEYYDAVSGKRLGRAKTTREFLTGCLILIAPASGKAVVENYMGIKFLSDDTPSTATTEPSD